MIEDITWRPYQNVCHKAIRAAKNRGIKSVLIKSATACHAPGTPILMFDGKIKNVEDIRAEDLLMGNDSTPRKVLELYKGRDEMYKIIPIKGESFIVNESHILSLKKTPTPGKYKQHPDKVNISIKDYLVRNRHFKHLYKLYKTGVEFNAVYKSTVPPYLLGLWIGDGSVHHPQIVSADDEIINYLRLIKLETNYKFRIYHKGNGLYSFYFSRVDGKRVRYNLYSRFFKTFVKDKEKVIPIRYIAVDYDSRLQILAGLMDSDGSLSRKKGYDFTNKSKSVTDTVAYLSRSVGLAAYVHKCAKTCTNNGKKGTYYRTQISGNVDIIPCKVVRKQALKRKMNKNVLVRGFKIEKIGSGTYHGFELDGNHLYCMGDFTVTHNTGKRLMSIRIVRHYPRTLFIAHREELIMQAFHNLEQYYPLQVGIIKAERFDNMSRIVIASAQTLHRRLHLLRKNDFPYIIVDEAHHFISPSFLKSLRHFEPELMTGWTATPKRLDGLSLSNIFEELVFSYGIEDGIKDGYLAKINGYQIRTQADLSAVRKQAGDFNLTQLSEKVDTNKRNQLIVDKYKEYSKGEQALTYCVDINHTIRLRDKFRENGIRSEAIVSDESLCPNRAEILHYFRKGKIQVLTNCEILTEGYDYSDIGAILMARPTQSETLYVQSIGRGTRLKSEAFKDRFGHGHCIVLDFVDNAGKHSLINTYELEKDKPATERIFLSEKDKEVAIREEKEKKGREIRMQVSDFKDRKLNMFRLPKIDIWSTWNPDKIIEPATEKQIAFLKKLNLWQENVEYTKGQCSELIGGVPAQYWQLMKLAGWGYDISKGATYAQFRKAEDKVQQKEKFKIDKTA